METVRGNLYSPGTQKSRTLSRYTQLLTLTGGYDTWEDVRPRDPGGGDMSIGKQIRLCDSGFG